MGDCASNASKCDPAAIAFATSSTSLAVIMLWVFIPLSYCAFGPVFALVQNLVPADMRSQAVALSVLSISSSEIERLEIR